MGSSRTREATLLALLERIRGVRPGERALVAIDGVDGAGKSHLADELVALAATSPGRPLLRVSIDGFHRPRQERYAAGRGPEGFYRASYAYDRFREAVVEPLRAGRPVVPAVWDVVADAPVPPAEVTLPADGIVVVDGIFLHRPELADVWDATVWLEVPFEVSVPRGNARFEGLVDDPESPDNARYVGGQRLYLAEADPAGRATWVLDNTDLDHPVLTDRGHWPPDVTGA
ncbi:uridine kinase [Actinomycetota bacterium]